MKIRWIPVLLAVLMCLLCGHALADTLQPGDSGEKVLELNTRLRQLNYTATRANDQYSDATKAAVSAVQEAYGLEVTGIADDETLAIIYGDCYRPLSYGDSGEDVSRLQEKLLELGYYWGNITGNYLEGTTAAIQTMQGENSMEITGTADVKTQEKLYSLLIRPTPTPTLAPTPGPTRVPTPTPGPRREFPRKLSYGSKGDDVALVQERLKELGFFTYKKITTGYYKNTQKAVEDFQKHNGLEVTGIVDESTWNVLFNDPDVADVLSPSRTYEPIPAEYFFEVDVNNQAVKVWRYNRETKGYTDLDRAFICATGTKTYPSPLGTFTLSGRKSPHCKFPTWGGGEARWWTKITEEIAFHSVLYGDSGDDMSLKVSSFNGLGKRGSHGCIRMTVADAKWIYEHAKKGMQVWIHEDGEDDPELKYLVRPGELNTKTMMPYETPAPPVYTYDGTQAPETVKRTLEFGMEGQDVYWLQSKLKELGFYKGTITGQYREGTKKAVSAYQSSRGMSPTGKANEKTLQRLYDEVRKENAATASITLNTSGGADTSATAKPTKTPKPSKTPKPTKTPSPTRTPSTEAADEHEGDRDTFRLDLTQ
ncbi:MAG: peptidoglycan-binding protein [Clostridia bacterium]|nr:peptidoglycan-binding protein [Clostridia bacterium]